jgi:D-glycero-D-manno-heptose 1,7-bisphosphate phosphatase
MKGIIFDIDGTLTGALSSHPENGFKQHPRDVIVLPGVNQGMEFHHKQGYVMVGASNQGGCSAINPETGNPRKSIEDAIAEMQFTLELLPLLESIYFCPDFEGDKCYKVHRNQNHEIFHRSSSAIIKETSFRKPGAGMLTKAAMDYNFDLAQSWMIGDRSEDMEAANNANCEYLDAETWRMRFNPGIFELQGVTMAQFELLEGVKYRV